ncbi:scavenger receptor cysteine-rich type 1 M130-like protein [Labeo rohita]|uniref:Scavenger receptor cysteine-rich type 1 M130-like protein n=1 Tax=Labeo rohita TaxID=84645 RepID=A0A498NT73_LABRO|nr:scavenger receptor cysteine-rich type 1 M130-like protein [Labeo rohita]
MNRDAASLICQELNCGISGSEPSISKGLKSHNWLDYFKCRRHDSTIWQCPSSPWGQNDCHNEVAKINCSGSLIFEELDSGYEDADELLLDLSVSTTPDTTTSASSPVLSTSVTLSQTASSILAVLVIVLVVVLLLLLVPLLILIQQNRVMRRAFSKRRHRMTTEAVYEEIQHNHFTQREMVNEITPEYYDDVITDGLKPDHETEDIPESYDDVIIPEHNSDIKVDTAEHYDDVIINGPDSQSVTEADQEEYDDVKNSNEDERNLLVDTPEHYDDVIINGQDSQGVTEADQEEYDDVKNSSEDERNLLDSSLALHDGLVRLSGERQCEGEVEVFIHQVWRRVLLDSWSLTESSVVCRQLGCGSVLNFYGSSSSSPERSHECVTGFQCSGSEAHLGNCSSPQTVNCSSTQQLSITCLGANNNIWCPSSPWGQNDCNKDEVAKIICSEQESDESPRSYLTCSTSPHHRQCSDLSVSTTPATTTSASPPVSLLVRSTSVTPPQTPPAESPQFFIPPELVIVLVVVLLLLLVPLLILIQQNRVMRRVLSKRRHRMTTEAIYEEIQHKPTNRHSLLTQREMVNEITPENYDVITDGLKPDHETEDTPESYDDVITLGHKFDIKEGNQEEYDDVKNSSEDEKNLLDYDDIGGGVTQ